MKLFVRFGGPRRPARAPKRPCLNFSAINTGGYIRVYSLQPAMFPLFSLFTHELQFAIFTGVGHHKIHLVKQSPWPCMGPYSQHLSPNYLSGGHIWSTLISH